MFCYLSAPTIHCPIQKFLIFLMYFLYFIDNGQNLGNNNIELSAKETETTNIHKVEDLGIASKNVPKPEEEIERPRWHR